MFNNRKVIVSMTSWTKRINNVPKVVFSILSNTIKPDSIELNLSSDEFVNKENDLPKEVLLLNQNGFININWVKENNGVFKKIIPTIKKYFNEDFYLISVDDDWLYNEDFIETLLKRLGDGDWYSLQNYNEVIGNSTIYRSYVFKESFWNNITDELVKIGIDDWYTTSYLRKFNFTQPRQIHNLLKYSAKAFNQIFPNSHNKTDGNGDYEPERVKRAYQITTEIMRNFK